MTSDQVRDYEMRCEAERRAANEVGEAIDNLPHYSAVATLERYAPLCFDGGCDSQNRVAQCGCAYCVAHRALLAVAHNEKPENPFSRLGRPEVVEPGTAYNCAVESIAVVAANTFGVSTR